VGSLVRSWEGGAGEPGFEDIGLDGNAVRTEPASRCWLYSAADWVSWLMPEFRADVIDEVKAMAVEMNRLSLPAELREDNSGSVTNRRT
jgi:hypothetical protein